MIILINLLVIERKKTFSPITLIQATHLKDNILSRKMSWVSDFQTCPTQKSFRSFKKISSILKSCKYDLIVLDRPLNTIMVGTYFILKLLGAHHIIPSSIPDIWLDSLQEEPNEHNILKLRGVSMCEFKLKS